MTLANRHLQSHNQIYEIEYTKLNIYIYKCYNFQIKYSNFQRERGKILRKKWIHLIMSAALRLHPIANPRDFHPKWKW